MASAMTRRLRSAAVGIERRALGTLMRVKTDRPLVALTFDDGPHPEYTPRLAEVLEARGARGTFFMIGRNAAAHPDVVRRVAEGGHAIGNHSWDHPRFPTISWRERRRQIRLCAEATAPFGLPLFRPPRGLQCLGSYLTVRSMGYRPVAWSAEASDWKERSAADLATDLVERIKPGGIVVLHDTLWDPTFPAASDRGPVVEAIETVLERMGDSFRFVTVPELVRLGTPIRRPWFVGTDDDWD